MSSSSSSPLGLWAASVFLLLTLSSLQGREEANKRLSDYVTHFEALHYDADQLHRVRRYYEFGGEVCLVIHIALKSRQSSNRSQHHKKGLNLLPYCIDKQRNPSQIVLFVPCRVTSVTSDPSPPSPPASPTTTTMTTRSPSPEITRSDWTL